jgi:micrococcal nuclease
MKLQGSHYWHSDHFFSAGPPHTWSWTGIVAGIANGDTITMLHDKKVEKIRLYGIDCPERRQVFGTRARQFTSKMFFKNMVDVDPVSKNRYARTIGIVKIAPVNLNEGLIRTGFGWVYVKYSNRPVCEEWEKL